MNAQLQVVYHTTACGLGLGTCTWAALLLLAQRLLVKAPTRLGAGAFFPSHTPLPAAAAPVCVQIRRHSEVHR